ncbi:MAG: glycosyltransferase [Dehalococcoidia bacterium]|nr:glycosyltransferase [Dehalococcoidia bacterium]
MLQPVDVGVQPFERYIPLLDPELVGEIRDLAGRLRGAKLLHINATPYGGGVSELLRSIVPILRDLGIDAHWQVIFGDEKFFRITKSFHNALQGMDYFLDRESKEEYRSQNTRNARLLKESYDYIVVHDPQPALLRHYHGRDHTKWVWRCHIDTSRPNPAVWEYLCPYIREYDAAIFTCEEFVPPDLNLKVAIIPPAIDPLSPKNMDLPTELCREVVDWMGIDPNRPIVSQISRFDPWKDPQGVVDAFLLVKGEVPDAQLVLIGSMALDDPEAWHIYHEIMGYTEQFDDIYISTNFQGVGNIEVNSLQRLSSVVVQKSLKEGFGLVVSEALWKGTPVVAGKSGGIPLQLQDGVSGFLTETVEECADRILYLLRHPEEARLMGQRGRKWVRQRFLIPRLIADELRLLASL